MLFLMNDVVFSLDGVLRNATFGGPQVKKLSMPAIIRMGQELYARQPNLQQVRPGQAQRLGALISAKAPMINAAHFHAPCIGAPPHDVTVRFVSISFEVMADLYILQKEGALDAVKADSRVWRRLAA